MSYILASELIKTEKKRSQIRPSVDWLQFSINVDKNSFLKDVIQNIKASNYKGMRFGEKIDSYDFENSKIDVYFLPNKFFSVKMEVSIEGMRVFIVDAVYNDNLNGFSENTISVKYDNFILYSDIETKEKILKYIEMLANPKSVRISRVDFAIDIKENTHSLDYEYMSKVKNKTGKQNNLTIINAKGNLPAGSLSIGSRKSCNSVFCYDKRKEIYESSNKHYIIDSLPFRCSKQLHRIELRAKGMYFNNINKDVKQNWKVKIDNLLSEKKIASFVKYELIKKGYECAISQSENIENVYKGQNMIRNRLSENIAKRAISALVVCAKHAQAEKQSYLDTVFKVASQFEHSLNENERKQRIRDGSNLLAYAKNKILKLLDISDI